MKTHLVVGIALLSLCLPLQAQDNNATRAEQYYRQGLVAIGRGDAARARASFQTALRLNPGHANARYQLLRLKDTEGQLAGKARELKLKEVRVPVVQFEDATLDEVLDNLDLAVRRETDEEFSPNFVIQDSSGKLAQAKVNIRLRNVPAKVILDYALDQARARATYDAHAILIRPAGKVGGAQPAASKPQETDGFPGG